MLQTVLAWGLKILNVLPNIITTMEQLWNSKPKSGAEKWIGVEQALSGSITLAANEIAKMAPAGTKAEVISSAIAKFTKACNDAFVGLMNDLGLFTTSK